MRKLGLIISLVLISQQITWSQTKVCVDKIRNFYELLETKVSEVNAEQPFEMKFTMDIVYANYGAADSTTFNAHVISDQSKRYFFGRETKVYQNEKLTASVSSKQLEIHLFDTPPSEYQAVVTKKYEFFEDTLFSVVDYAVCKGSQVSLFFKEGNILANGIKEIKFGLGGNQIVQSIETIYYTGHQYVRIRVDYEKIDFSSSTELLKKDLMANIMVENELLPEYKNYKLYDHRKNK